ncbi:MAG: radical SAM protein [Candidatus Thorarchaeota archaeon]
MKIEVEDKSLMMIFLLEVCNFACSHCLREDEPMKPGYRLSSEQLRLCLSDCRKMESISWVHFTGGEPTLWTEGKRSLVDLLLEIAKAGFTPGFTTNGSLFIDYSRCHDFFAKCVNSSTMPLGVYLSIDTFHRNFHPDKGRAQSLDNVMKCKQKLPSVEASRLDVSVIATISKDFKSLLPEEMIRYYESSGVAIGFIPLKSMGKAKSFSHLCPDLSSENPEDLGAYRHFHEKRSQKKQGKIRNQYSAEFINLIGNDYYFTKPWRKVARLGHLPDTILLAYTNLA